MSWQDILAELERKRAFSASMGGKERLERVAGAGKLNARQRAEALFDSGTFTEIGGLAGNLSEGGQAPAPADGLIAGFGLVEGRPVLVGIEDGTASIRACRATMVSRTTAKSASFRWLRSVRFLEPLSRPRFGATRR